MTGTEVERVEHHGVTALENFVDRPRARGRAAPQRRPATVCVVDIGDGEPSQIVCGAPNVAAGQTVAVAKPGAVMPDGTKLGKAKLRGVESNGMILAEDELAIGDRPRRDHGARARRARARARRSRTCCRSRPTCSCSRSRRTAPTASAIYGVAREVHAATGAPLAPAPWRDDPGEPGEVDGATIIVECPDLCPRFTARVFEDVKIGPSPLWLKARLMAAGQRPISNVVDITNYVMLLTGQPLHAFDLDRVAGATLTVRRAHDGEQVETLDGQTRTLDADMVLIEDADGPTSIAGVMGGARSEVGADTTRVLMEVANWNGPNIHRTSLKLGLRSEASGRFEKGLQPEQAMEAQAVATQLMIELCGARLVPGTIDVGGAGPPPQTIRAARRARREAARRRRSRASGAPRSCRRSGSRPRDAQDGLDVTVPAFRRGDVTREADLIEEVARHRRPREAAGDAALAPRRLGPADRSPAAAPARRRRARGPGAARDRRLELHRPRARRPAAPRRRPRAPAHGDAGQPDVDRAVASCGRRCSARCSTSARHNRARGAATVRLFEAGAVYLPTRPGAAAARAPPPRRGPGRPGASAELARRPPARGRLLRRQGRARGPAGRAPARLGSRASRTSRSCTRAARRASSSPARDAGWLGEIHPLVAAEWDCATRSPGSSSTSTPCPSRRPRSTTTSASFPDVREDLAVVVAERVTAAELIAVVRRAGGPLLAGAEVFDVYRDPERLGAGNVSLAVALTYRAPDRTLTDEEVAGAATRSPRRSPTSSGGGSVPHSVSVFGSAGFTGALTARLLLPPPVVRAARAHRAQRRRAPARRPVPAPPRAARARGARPRPPRRRRCRGRRLPARRLRAARRRAARAGRAGRRPERRLPPARPRGVRSGTASTRRRS